MRIVGKRALRFVVDVNGEALARARRHDVALELVRRINQPEGHASACR